MSNVNLTVIGVVIVLPVSSEPVSQVWHCLCSIVSHSGGALPGNEIKHITLVTVRIRVSHCHRSVWAVMGPDAADSSYTKRPPPIRGYRDWLRGIY
jgi:hypothetical protein